MRIKIYLHPNRDIELIAVRFNPTLNFGKLAKEAIKAHVRGGKFSFVIPSVGELIARPLICYLTLDEKTDADLIAFINTLVISKSAFVRNIMLRAIEGRPDVYTNVMLQRKIKIYLMHKKI